MIKEDHVKITSLEQAIENLRNIYPSRTKLELFLEKSMPKVKQIFEQIREEPFADDLFLRLIDREIAITLRDVKNTDPMNCMF